MSRLRATIAPSDEDRQIAQHLDAAVREVEAALVVARAARKGPVRHRARQTAQELEGLIAGLNGVRTISPRHGMDPDLLPEEERIRLHREKMAREREEREAKRRAEVISG